MVGLEGPVRFQTEAGGVPLSAGAVLAHPDVPHAAEADDRPVAVAFVHPESSVGARLLARGGAGIETFGGETLERMREALRPARTREELIAGAARALAALGIGDAPPPIRHPGVRRVLRHLRSNAPARDESLAALARVSGLSPSRLVHVFTTEVGVPLRPYLRWLKLERAALALGAGASQAAAAQAAGFADAAHMARSFRKMLGTTPATLRRSQTIQDARLPRAAASTLRAQELSWPPPPSASPPPSRPASGPAAP
jgi:AraC-like DNA-binding protein